MIRSLNQYEAAIAVNGFQEFPMGLSAGMTMLESFVDFPNADVDLKIHLATIILNRNFSWLDGHMQLTDQFWLIRQFLHEYQQDLIKPWISSPVRKAMNMIISGDTFTDGVLGSSFMFGVVEFYAKYVLGWRPLAKNEWDDHHEPYRDMTLADAITKVKKTNTAVARSLNKVDKLIFKCFKVWEAPKNLNIKLGIAERLQYARNAMVQFGKIILSLKSQALIKLARADAMICSFLIY